MLNFEFFERGVGIVNPPHFVYDFSKKLFLLYSNKGLNFIVRLLSLYEILGSICISMVC